MITIQRTGNLLKTDVEALVNTVNTIGIMGKGIALQFKMTFPNNFKAYKSACDKGEVQAGKMFVYHKPDMFNPRFIINFPTKKHWREKSKLEYVKSGMDDLVKIIKEYDIKSIAIPPLGCGNGQLYWTDVQKIIEEKMETLPNVKTILYAPSKDYSDVKKPKKNATPPKMTSARAYLIGLLNGYKKAGYEISLLEIQKLMYFLQESGENLKLQYTRHKFGPYANNLNHLLQAIEGYFITGYGDRTTQTHIKITEEGLEKANYFIDEHKEMIDNYKNVLKLIEGFETPYGLELLSTVHWTMKQENKTETGEIIKFIKNWSPRKKQMFTNKHIEVATEKLQHHQFISAR